jgi:hypothetical protein
LGVYGFAVAKKARIDDSAGAQPMEQDTPAEGLFTEGNVHDLMPLYYRCARVWKAASDGVRALGGSGVERWVTAGGGSEVKRPHKLHPKRPHSMGAP